MSRSGYVDDLESWEHIMWRGAVASAIRGKRGQALLAEMLVVFDAMPVKELIVEELERDGQHCALGVVGKARGLPLGEIDVYEREEVGKAFNIAGALASEIAFINDEGGAYWKEEDPKCRWARVREWVSEQILRIDTNDQ